eukprot:CAMPEP_0115072086 /NCGR_PEP_ID=MMETSP0227-20121206/14031_1 /TAXON_ID=89957 /ORGANISM="Polarella glacialis, Strain CCMP 1383" /LENGTH=52 /DNA_ID=CAMNT_0002458787 /DNA_START=292 /DNA_END=450 /DNA_ORIENTATION=+
MTSNKCGHGLAQAWAVRPPRARRPLLVGRCRGTSSDYGVLGGTGANAQTAKL